ncbi:MAG: MFS transporter [Deltaproteobacteria bacterium]|nr:MFS transporter [Deltaproteobacteria bacterium]
MMKQRRGVRIYYGWWIVLITFYSTLIFSGCIYFSFSLFVKPLQAEFGWDRSTIMAAFTFLFLSLGFSSPIAGRAVDRYGPKVVMTLGTMIAAFGFLSLFLLTTLPHYYISYFIIGIGGAAMGPVAATAVVSEWFQEKRGLAIGLMSTGIGAGGFVIAPLVGGLIIPGMGWRAGYLSICLLTITLIPLLLWIVKSRHSYQPAHRNTPTKGKKRETPVREIGGGLNLREALTSTAFYLIAGAFMISQFSLNASIQSQVPHLQDIGFPVMTASAALGMIGLVSAFSKLFFGWFCDRIDPKYAFCIGIVFMAGGTFTLMQIVPTSPLLSIWLYALVIGFGAGSWLPTMSMLVSRNFGLTAYGAIFGAVTMAHHIGVSTGPLFAGYIYDRTAGYHMAFVVLMILYLCALPAMLACRRPGMESPYKA